MTPAVAAYLASVRAPITAAPSRVWDPTTNPNDPLIKLDLRYPGSFDALVAPWGACILNGAEGRGKCVQPPRDGGNYSYAMPGGRKAIIPMGLPHADIRLPVSAAIQHYADTGYAAAVGEYFEDERGIWFMGDLVPGISERDRFVIAAAALSGDWRWIEEHRRYRMIASQVVNTPGFRPAHASEYQFAMAASAGALITTWEPFDWRGELLARLRGEHARGEIPESAVRAALLAAIKRVPAGRKDGGRFASDRGAGGFSMDDVPSDDALAAHFAGTEYATGAGPNAVVGQQKLAWAYEQTGFNKTLPERVDFAGDVHERSDVEIVVHRGVGDGPGDHSADEYHERLLNGDHYVGVGRYGNGTYTTPSAGEARSYARLGATGGGTMTTIGIKKGTRIVDFESAKRDAHGNYVGGVSSLEALSKGAQVMRIKSANNADNDYYVVFDRSATVMASEPESVGVRPVQGSVRDRLLAWIAGATGKPGGRFGTGGHRIPGSGSRKGAPPATRSTRVKLDEHTVALFRGGSAASHLEPDGKGGVRFTAERHALHEKIIGDALATGSNVTVTPPPSFTMLGGGAASGKSTVLNVTGLKVDPDAIKAQLPEYHPKTGVAFTHEESSYLAKQITSRGLAARYDVTVDGVGSNVESVAAKIAEARSHGYRVEGVYVTTSVSDALGRNRSRQRTVPQAILRHGHAQVSANFERLAPLYDSISLTENPPNRGPLVTVARTVNGSLVIEDKAAWRRFQAKKPRSGG